MYWGLFVVCCDWSVIWIGVRFWAGRFVIWWLFVLIVLAFRFFDSVDFLFVSCGLWVIVSD